MDRAHSAGVRYEELREIASAQRSGYRGSICTPIPTSRGRSSSINAPVRRAANVPTTFKAQSTIDIGVDERGCADAWPVSLLKIANDLRWMARPAAGLGELDVPAVSRALDHAGQGQSVIFAESLTQCAQCDRNDTTIVIAARAQF